MAKNSRGAHESGLHLRSVLSSLAALCIPLRCLHHKPPNLLPCCLLTSQQVLRQRLRAMELQLVQLRAEQAERTLADVHRRHELSTAAKLE